MQAARHRGREVNNWSKKYKSKNSHITKSYLFCLRLHAINDTNSRIISVRRQRWSPFDGANVHFSQKGRRYRNRRACSKTSGCHSFHWFCNFWGEWKTGGLQGKSLQGKKKEGRTGSRIFSRSVADRQNSPILKGGQQQGWRGPAYHSSVNCKLKSCTTWLIERVWCRSPPVKDVTLEEGGRRKKFKERTPSKTGISALPDRRLGHLPVSDRWTFAGNVVRANHVPANVGAAARTVYAYACAWPGLRSRDESERPEEPPRGDSTDDSGSRRSLVDPPDAIWTLRALSVQSVQPWSWTSYCNRKGHGMGAEKPLDFVLARRSFLRQQAMNSLVY